MRLAIFVMAGLMLTGPAAAAPAPGTPEAFLQDLYANYTKGSDFTTLDSETSWFSPGLIKLIKQDQAKAGADEGNLEEDPVCDCQDYGDFKVLSIKVTPLAGDKVMADISFTNLGDKDEVKAVLVKEAAGWRIDDVSSSGMPSLRALLVQPE